MENLSTNIKNILVKELGIRRLTGPSLKKAIVSGYDRLPDDEKRRLSGEIARNAIKAVTSAKERKKYEKPGETASLRGTKVLAINHSGPLDVTIEWKTGPDGTLDLTECHIHSGGDQVNVSKVLSDFGQNIALVALAGKEGSEITDAWERNFLNKRIIPALIRNTEDQQVAVINMVDGDPLPVMFGWADELSEKTVEKIEREALAMLEDMFKGGTNTIWMVLSAGGPLRYNKDLAYYAKLVKRVKKKYQDRVEFLIDFMHISGPEEAMSVLELPRETPQDIIKPNLEEFIQVLVSSGLAESGALDKNTMTDEDVKEYALKLRSKYNLLGVLVSRGGAGLILALRDRVIREKGIKIRPACHTAAGDSLKAGVIYALSRGSSFEEAVHTGNLFGAATAAMEGSRTVTSEKLAETAALARAQNVSPEVEYL